MSQRDAYIKKLEAQMDAWDAKIEELKAQGKSAQADAELNTNKQLEDLRELREQVRKELDRLRDSSDHAWEDIKQGADAAARRFKK